MPFNFISLATEQTTAITDLILSGQSMVCLYLVRPRPENQSVALSLWSWVLGLLAFSSLLGAFVHGIELAPETQGLLWGPLYFALGLLVTLVALASLAHMGYENISRRLIPASIGLAFVFAVLAQSWSNSFLLFVAYEAVMMTVAMGIYIACLWGAVERQGAGLLSLGVFFTLVAAAVDSQSSLRLQCIWSFDNHGIFHLIQMFGLLILSLGLYRSRMPCAGVESNDAKR